MMDLIDQLLEAAVIESRTVPKMMWRNGELVWRAVGGVMVQLTIVSAGQGIVPTMAYTYEVA